MAVTGPLEHRKSLPAVCYAVLVESVARGVVH